VLKALYNAGIRHFDTASLPEIAQVRESFGDAACYFMHPVKGRAVINTSARVYEIDTFVIDHMDELEKILKETGGAEGLTIYVRIKTPPAEGTLYHLAAKFGAGIVEAAAMLKEAQSRGCQVGVAFHVGSQCLTPGAYATALQLVGEVLEQAKVQIAGLDVGGGFPAAYLGTNMPPLEDFVSAIEAGVKQLGLRRDCVLMCEPGRALVAHAISVVTQVQLRKDDQLYINDGIYGSLSETVDAGLRLPARLVRIGADSRAPARDFTLNGPTCDSLDVLPSPFALPEDVREGDWIEIDRVGAYSNALATRFNGFHPETMVTVHDRAIMPSL
jgi:ornithine decarboxylase